MEKKEKKKIKERWFLRPWVKKKRNIMTGGLDKLGSKSSKKVKLKADDVPKKKDVSDFKMTVNTKTKKDMLANS